MANADRPTKRATIRDVAARVDLSTSTVSAALNGGGVLKESTRERVRRAAAELGYRPSRTALAFRLGRTGTIAYSLPVVDEGSVSLLGVEAYMVGARAAASAAFESGYALTLTPPQLRGEAAWNLLGVDGVVLCDPEFNDERLNTLERLGVPVVTIERDASRPDSPFVVAGDYQGNAVKVLDHLRAQGAETIALLLPDASWSSTEDSRRGYEAWAKEHGMEPLIRRVPIDRAHNDAYGATMDLLTGEDRPDAIFATVEQYRARVLLACHDAGLRAPEDILIALGGDSQAAEHGNPSVTAIDQQSALNSELAVKMLLRRIDGEDVPGAIITEGALRVRQSTRRRDS